MPNWCYNNLDISAKTPEQTEMLERVSKAEDGAGFISQFLPLPDVLKDTTAPSRDDMPSEQREALIAETGYDNWYTWQVENWGTKWDPEVMSADFDGITLSLSFDSAWSPPIAFYEWLHENGYEVSATYYEPGMDYAGEWCMGDDFCIDGVSELARQDETSLSTREYDILEQWGIWEEIAQYDEED